MSMLTIQLRTICEYYAGHSEAQMYQSIEGIIENAMPKIFDFDYPIYDETHRETLQRKILSRYYMSEIGLETPALWKHELKNLLWRIMPIMNQRYESLSIEFNPMHNADVTQIIETKTDGTNTSTSTDNVSNESNSDVTYKGTEVIANTPQDEIPTLEIESMSHMSGASVNNAATNTKSDSSGESHGEIEGSFENKGEGKNITTGKNSSESFSEMLKKYRDTFINVDEEIVRACGVLFTGINIWQN